MTKLASPKLELAALRALTHKDWAVSGEILGSLDPSFFDAEESREVYGAVKASIAANGKPPTYKLLLEDPSISKDARAFLRDSEPTVQTRADATRVVESLAEYRRRRLLYELAAHIDQQMQSPKLDSKALLDHAGDSIAKARVSRSQEDSFLHFGVGNNSMSFVENLLYEDPGDEVIPSGIPEFDEESGGFQRGSLVTIGASSGGGKSLVAGVAMPMAQARMGYKVVVVPLEMNKREMTSRFIANLSGLDVTRVLQGKLTANEKDKAMLQYKRFLRKVRQAGGRLTVFKPKGEIDMQETLASVNALGADVRYIDYLNLLSGAEGDDSWKKLMDMARYAKINAEQTNTVNVVLVQVNEEGKIRYSRGVSEHSTNSWVWNARPEERAKQVGTIDIEQPKSRNSKSYRLTVGLHWAFMRVVKPTDAAEVPDVDTPKNLAADV